MPRDHALPGQELETPVSPSSPMSADVMKTVLPNGLTVISQALPDRRTLSLGAWLRTGSRDEPRERLGITHFIEHMMFKGTGTRARSRRASSPSAATSTRSRPASRSATRRACSPST